jgi:putative ATPase
MRPASLDEVMGQAHLLGEGAFLREVLDSGEVPCLLLWGPPGVGKTTLARLIARRTGCHYRQLSAVAAGTKDVRTVVAQANEALRYEGRGTVLFLDEIHRFNKAQQDALLPHLEDGTLTLVGATTENPSFEVNAALLSRMRVVPLEPLPNGDLTALLGRALADEERGLGAEKLKASEQALELIATLAGGDARAALNLLELSTRPMTANPEGERALDVAGVRRAAERRQLVHDKSGDRHFDLISAFHKSMRASDADATLYWLARMLEAGEDPLYVARRIVRFASEDVGLADPHGLAHANAAFTTVQRVGMPEGKLALAQAAVYLSLAPKSNALYTAYKQAAAEVLNGASHPVPLHLRNAPTALMKKLGFGGGYQYAHDAPHGIGTQPCLPEALQSHRFYTPTERGFEQRLRDRSAYITNLKSEGVAAEPAHD